MKLRLAMIAMAAALALPSLACAQQSGAAAQDSSGAPDAQGSHANGTYGQESGAEQSATALPPQEFVSQAIEGDNSDIALGKMAESQASTSGAKKFGHMLVADHTRARRQMEHVANELGVTPNDQMMPDAQQEQQKLQAMSGQDFDREFVSYMVHDHQKDIATFKAEAAANNGPASKIAAKQLPVLEKHLRVAQSLQDQGHYAQQ